MENPRTRLVGCVSGPAPRPGSGGRTAFLRAAVVLLSLLVQSAFAQSVEPRIALGRDFLLNHRNPDGGWPRSVTTSVAPSDLTATAEVLRALVELRATGRLGVEGVTSLSAPYVQAVVPTDNLTRARKLVAGQAAGVGVSVERQALLDFQNGDGGWGVADGKQSNPIDTAIVLDALLGQGLSLTGTPLSHARDYLLNTAE